MYVGCLYSTTQPQCQIFFDLKVTFMGLTWLPNCPCNIVALGKGTRAPGSLLIARPPLSSFPSFTIAHVPRELKRVRLSRPAVLFVSIMDRESSSTALN